MTTQTSNYRPDDIPRLFVLVDNPREFGSNHPATRNYSDAYPHPSDPNRQVRVEGLVV
jgi:hypothetical protein